MKTSYIIPFKNDRSTPAFSIKLEVKDKCLVNLGKNIWTTFSFLSPFLFPASEIELDYNQHRDTLLDASQITEQLTT